MSGDGPDGATIEFLTQGSLEVFGVDDVFVAACNLLRDADGVALDRASCHIHHLHPEFLGSSIYWSEDQRQGRISTHDTAVFLAHKHLENPINLIFYHGAERIEQRFDRPLQGPHYPIYDDLARDGVVHYIALPLKFTSNTPMFVSFATKSPGGFTDAEQRLLARAMAPLAMAMEIRHRRRVMKNLMEAYIGKRTAERIYEGAVYRGAGAELDAVIWMADLQGFTHLSETAPRAVVLETLDAFFEIMGDAIERHGGEISKFIGDALLAIFPTDDLDATERALEAAQEAIAAIDDANRARAEEGKPLLRFGLALHRGEVTYGNIGARRRLDFTVIGPAVNETARIESLCRSLGRSFLASARIADALGRERFEDLGEHRLKGVGRAVSVFGLIDENRASRP